MIDNIILLITGTLHQRQIAELRTKCHPLGSFEEMESINIASTPADLYSAVLVDTPLGMGPHDWESSLFHPSPPSPPLPLPPPPPPPLLRPPLPLVGPYFKHCVSQTDLDEVNIEVIRNTLYKVRYPFLPNNTMAPVVWV